MTHDQAVMGEPCRRCGIPCSRETADVPCFEEGDTFETWKARQPAELFKSLFQPPVARVPVDHAAAATQALLHMIKHYNSRFQVTAAAAAVDALLALMSSHVRELEARVKELEVKS